MLIQWLGQACFKIQTKNNNEETTIVIDPFDDKDRDFKMPKIQADILMMSHDHSDHNNADAIKGEPFVIVNPGEYEYKGVFVYGLPAYHDDKNGQERGKITMFKIISEEIHIAHLSDLGHVLSDEQLERLGNVDILMVPVGGFYTIDPSKAVEVISQIEPRIVIPMHYKVGNKETKLKGVEDFLKISGMPNEKMEKYKITKKDLLSQVETKIIVLES